MRTTAAIDACRRDMFADRDTLLKKYDAQVAERVMRIREMYTWKMSYPESTDRAFVQQFMARYGVSKSCAYADLSLIKQLIPMLTSASRDFHRWRTNEMLLESYAMAKKRKDTKSMVAAAREYGRLNRVDLEDEQLIPYDDIVIQPFTATTDPSVLGIKPIPNLQEKIQAMLAKYKKESMDIEDVEYEEADLEENELFPHEKDEEQTEQPVGANPQTGIFQ